MTPDERPQPDAAPTKETPTKKHGWGRRFFALFAIALLLAAGWAAYDASSFLSTPGSLPAREVVISIPAGATFDRVAWELKKAGAIQDVPRFRLLGQYKGAIKSVKAGDFLVSTGWTPEQVLWQITSGQAVLYRLTVREGLTWWETAKIIEAQGFATYNDFKAVIHSPVFLAKHHIPLGNAEGFLFPETYMLKKPKAMTPASAELVADLMVNTFWRKTQPLWLSLQGQQNPAATGPTGGALAARQNATVPFAQNATPAPVANATGASIRNATIALSGNATVPAIAVQANPDDVKRLVILASLVEKETGVPEERARVAGVYTNRLEKNMRLECDPTIIYGVGESFSGAIRRSQLNDAGNPYNTFQHAGLPPGPICSSGLDAIKAAFSPEKHDYFFFVATGLDKSHIFSKDLDGHNRAVAAYRANVKNSKQ